MEKVEELKEPAKPAVPPEEPGWYIWLDLDFHSVDSGLIEVRKDPESHIAYLRGNPPERQTGYRIYKNSRGETLTMYFQSHRGEHNPYCNLDSLPNVFGYVPFSWTDVDKEIERQKEAAKNA